MYESIDACPGKKVIAGIKRRVFYIPKSDIVKWPKLPDVGSEDAKKMGDLATYVGNFTLKAEAYWRHFDLKDNSSGVTWDTAGEVGSHRKQGNVDHGRTVQGNHRIPAPV